MSRYTAMQEHKASQGLPLIDAFDAAIALIELVGGLCIVFMCLFVTGLTFYIFGAATGFCFVALFWGPMLFGLLAEYNQELWALAVFTLLLAISGLFLYIAFAIFW